jgi:hypothetical protein
VTPDSPANICVQAYTKWSLALKALGTNATAEQLAALLLADPRMSEDCLSVKVVVPPEVLEKGCKKASKKAKLGKNSPCMSLDTGLISAGKRT